MKSTICKMFPGNGIQKQTNKSKQAKRKEVGFDVLIAMTKMLHRKIQHSATDVSEKRSVLIYRAGGKPSK
jgi:hypothetical protein